MLLALPLLVFAGTLLEMATNDDSPEPDRPDDDTAAKIGTDSVTDAATDTATGHDPML